MNRLIEIGDTKIDNPFVENSLAAATVVIGLAIAKKIYCCKEVKTSVSSPNGYKTTVEMKE